MANVNNKTTELKFDYNSAELYISKYNIYGSKLFVLVDIENNTLVKGWSASSVCSPNNCNYRVLTDVTQKKSVRFTIVNFLKDILKSKKASLNKLVTMQKHKP